jgi:hypothetical protein
MGFATEWVDAEVGAELITDQCWINMQNNTIKINVLIKL